MALQTIKCGMFLPERPRKRSGTGEADQTIAASGNKFAMIFQVPKTGTITKVGFFTRVVSNSQTLRVGLESLDANGDPSGVQYGGSAVGTQTSPAQLTYYEVTLATGASSTRGNTIAAVIQFDSTVGSVAINCASGVDIAFPYTDFYSTSWTKAGSAAYLTIGYSDGTYEPIFLLPVNSQTTYTNFNSSSVPDERALRFSLPYPVTVQGFWGDFGYGANFDIVLYEGTTALLTYSVVNVNKQAGSQYGTYLFNSSVNLSKDTVYRLAIKPTTTTNVSVLEITVNTAAMLDMLSGGQAFHFSSRADAGAWSDTTTRRPIMGLILSAADDGVGGGGGMIVNPGMSGGLNG